MSCHKKWRFLLLLTIAAAWLAPAAFALDTGDIVVVKISGDVRIVVDGKRRTLKAGAALVPPATIETGKNGAVELQQGETTVSISADTKVDFPALETKSGPIDRIVQQRGNAFYKIGKRGGRQMRVETPYLVGCIKGTQFNVNVQDLSSTISLFEGRLEVRAADESDVVDLLAGQVATRKRDDPSIGVLKMDAKPAPLSRPMTSTPVAPRREVAESFPHHVDLHADLRATDIALPAAEPATALAAVALDTASPADVFADTASPATDGGHVTAPPNVIEVPAVSAPDTGLSPQVGVVAPVTPPEPSGPVVPVDPATNDDAALGIDDGNNGHGNDPDHDDSSNPGHSSHGKGPSTPKDVDHALDDATRRRK